MNVPYRMRHGAACRERRSSASRSPRWFTIIVLALTLSLSVTPAVPACNVPVFRYALERWRPDPFDAVVFHRGPLTDEQQALVDAWRERSAERRGLEESPQELVNAEITLVDLDDAGTPRDFQLLWEKARTILGADPALPYVVVRAPGDPRKPLITWHGALDDKLWRAACDSAARRELRKRLIAGHSFVWLFVQGAEAAENQRVQKLLDERLPDLEKRIELPEGIGTDGVDLLTDVPLAVKFSAVVVRRDDPQERLLLQQLAAHVPELAEGKTEPVLLPVFGCGRVLDAIVGEDIDGEVLADASEFLCGACSCQVKNLNPGFDLLMAGDWDALLALAGQGDSTTTTSGKSSEPPAEPKYVPIPGKRASDKPKSDAEPLAVASATTPRGGAAEPAISAGTGPLRENDSSNELPPTYGTSRSNRDQAERWPTSITAMMVVIGTIAVVVLISRTVERRRRLRETEES